MGVHEIRSKSAEKHWFVWHSWVTFSEIEIEVFLSFARSMWEESVWFQVFWNKVSFFVSSDTNPFVVAVLFLQLKKKEITFSFLATVFSVCGCLWSSGTVSFLRGAGICSLTHTPTFPTPFFSYLWGTLSLSEEVFTHCPSFPVLESAWFTAASRSDGRKGLLAVILEVLCVSNDPWLYWKRMLQWQQAPLGGKTGSLSPSNNLCRWLRLVDRTPWKPYLEVRAWRCLVWGRILQCRMKKICWNSPKLFKVNSYWLISSSARPARNWGCFSWVTSGVASHVLRMSNGVKCLLWEDGTVTSASSRGTCCAYTLW